LVGTKKKRKRRKENDKSKNSLQKNIKGKIEKRKKTKVMGYLVRALIYLM
jgi:hypothetical protein